MNLGGYSPVSIYVGVIHLHPPIAINKKLLEEAANAHKKSYLS